MNEFSLRFREIEYVDDMGNKVDSLHTFDIYKDGKFHKENDAAYRYQENCDIAADKILKEYN